MSKKFLTVFALVALLVAAMAGAAMAGEDEVTSLDKVAGTHLGAIAQGDKTGDAQAYSTKAYYLEGANIASMDATVEVTLDTDAATPATYFISADKISGDKPISFDVTPVDGSVNALNAGTFELAIELGGFGAEMPTAASIDAIGVWADGTTKPAGGKEVAQLDIAFEGVEAGFVDEDGAAVPATFPIDGEFISADLTVKGFDTSFDFGSVSVSYGQADPEVWNPLTSASTDVISTDASNFVMASFDAGVLHLEQTGVASGEITIVVYGNQMVMLEDDNAAVAGFDADVPIAEITITTQTAEPPAGSGGIEDPSPEVIAELEEEFGITIITSDDPRVSVDVTTPMAPAAFESTRDADGDAIGGLSVVVNDVIAGVDAREAVTPFYILEAETIVAAVDTDSPAAALEASFDIVYQFVDPVTGPKSDDIITLVGSATDAIYNWAEAIEAGVVAFTENGGIRVNYIVVNGGGWFAEGGVLEDLSIVYDGGNFYDAEGNLVGTLVHEAGSYVLVYDGVDDNQILDPLWVIQKASGGGGGGGGDTYHSDSGCDAGFGAFALLGLAGAAALLRRKD